MTATPPGEFEVVVIGAGAAGLLAAARAAQRGRRTLLLEKNRKPGVKILMSGGTRCNLTHATDAAGIIAAFGPAGRFLHSALAALPPDRLVALLEAEGLRTKVEATGKIFPASDRAADVLQALLRLLQRSGATLALAEPLQELHRDADGFRLVTARRECFAPRVVLTTGGRSYPGCGTTGDGYSWLETLGHRIVPPRPALVPLVSDAPWVRALQGVAVEDVLVRVAPAEDPSPRRGLDQRRGDMLLTHFGLSGPAVLDVSRTVSGHPQPRSLALVCDLLPDSSAETLDDDLRQRAAEAPKRQVVNLLPEKLPRRLCETLIQQAGISAARRGADLSREERKRLVGLLKAWTIPLAGTRGFHKAEVTTGGVALDEVDSRTMQSRKVPGLFLAGEILDLDGHIGGYNFQAAFSTGWLAGECV